MPEDVKEELEKIRTLQAELDERVSSIEKKLEVITRAWDDPEEGKRL